MQSSDPLVLAAVTAMLLVVALLEVRV